MKLATTILYKDGSTSGTTYIMPRFKKIGNATVVLGNKLKKDEQNLAAIKVKGYGTWVNADDKENFLVVDEANRNNLFWQIYDLT